MLPTALLRTDVAHNMASMPGKSSKAALTMRSMYDRDASLKAPFLDIMSLSQCLQKVAHNVAIWVDMLSRTPHNLHSNRWPQRAWKSLRSLAGAVATHVPRNRSLFFWSPKKRQSCQNRGSKGGHASDVVMPSSRALKTLCRWSGIVIASGNK